MAELRFVSTGFGSIIQANMISAVMRYNVANAKRKVKEAKDAGMLLDFTARRPIKSIILLTDGHVVVSAFTVGTIYKRICEAITSIVSFSTHAQYTLPEAAAIEDGAVREEAAFQKLFPEEPEEDVDDMDYSFEEDNDDDE